MLTMPAARIHAPDDVRLDSVEQPAPGPDDILVRVAFCGICGSDLSYVRIGGLPGAQMPFAIGHEFSGVVEAVGANVSHLAAGDRVVVNPEAGNNGIGSDGSRGAFSPLIVVHRVAQVPGSVFKLPEQSRQPYL